MSLPASFARDGFVSAADIHKGRRFKGLLIGSDGPADSGKTEFAMSAPGPGIVIGLDRGSDGPLDNPHPPSERQENFAFNVIEVPKASQLNQAGYLEYWKSFYAVYLKALGNQDARTVVIDGDSDSWELQRLAEFGRLSKVPPNLYDNVNGARRAMYARAYDSGKIIFATNKVRKSYVTKLDANGKPEVNNSGNEVRIWDGGFERQGFSDQEYLWSIQLRHKYDPDKKVWGVRLMKCKAQPKLVGYELWGDDCNFAALVQTVYPHIELSEWGYK